MIEIKNLTKTFGKKTALNNLSVTLEPGVIGLLGPNGSGKTTLLRTMTGLYRTKAGQILLNGKDVTNTDALPAVTGYLPQKFGMFKELSVYDMMDYFAVLKKIPKAEKKAEIERVVEFVNLSDRMRDRVGSLSGGMVRRLGIAQAVLGNPKVLLFDEPTAGLDPEERMRFKNMVRQLPKDTIVLISTHIVEDVEAVCDHVMVMRKGTVLANKTGEELAAVAKGRTYKVSGAKEGALPPEAYIRARTEAPGEGAVLTVLSAVLVDGELIPTTIEDGYLCLLKNICRESEGGGPSMSR